MNPTLLPTELPRQSLDDTVSIKKDPFNRSQGHICFRSAMKK